MGGLDWTDVAGGLRMLKDERIRGEGRRTIFDVGDTADRLG